jgi:hypothetical protein
MVIHSGLCIYHTQIFNSWYIRAFLKQGCRRSEKRTLRGGNRHSRNVMFSIKYTQDNAECLTRFWHNHSIICRCETCVHTDVYLEDLAYDIYTARNFKISYNTL